MSVPSYRSPSPSLPARAGTRGSGKEMRPSDCSSTLEGVWSSDVKKIKKIFDEVNLNDTH